MKFTNFDPHFSDDGEPTTPLRAETLLSEYADGRRHFNNVDLRDCNLAHAKLSMISLEEAILQKVNLSSANLAGATLNHVDFSFATLTNTNFIAADLVRAKLIGANLAGAVMSGANLSGASFRKANLTNCSFAGANLSGVDFSGAVLSHANFGGANLKGANLSDVDLTDIDLTDLDLTETILPESLAGERWSSQNRDLSLNFDEVVPGWGTPIADPTPVQNEPVQGEMMQSRMIPAESGRYLVNPNQDEDSITEYQANEYAGQDCLDEGYIASNSGTDGDYVVNEYIEYVTEEYTEEYITEAAIDTDFQTNEETSAILPLGTSAEAEATGLDASDYAWPEHSLAMDDDDLYLNALDALDAIAMEDTEAFDDIPAYQQTSNLGDSTSVVSPFEHDRNPFVIADSNDGDIGQEPAAQGDHSNNPFLLGPPPEVSETTEISEDQPPANPPEPFMVGAIDDDLSMTAAQGFAVEPSQPWPSDDQPIPLEDANTTPTEDTYSDPPEDTNTAPTEDTYSDSPEDTNTAPTEDTYSDPPENTNTALTEDAYFALPADNTTIDPSDIDPSEDTHFVQPETSPTGFDSMPTQAASVTSSGDSPAMAPSTDLPSTPAPRKGPDSATVHDGAKANYSLNSRVVHSIQAALGRRVQYSLQRKLLDIYHEKCAITDCDIQPLLDTVFITSHDRDKADHPSQCLVLRADLKTLYDLKLLAIHPQRLTVLLSPQLLESDYGRLQGHKITIPEQKIYHPSSESLTQNLKDCTWYDDSYQERSQPVVLAPPEPRPETSQRWISLPSLVALGLGMVAGAGLIWPVRSALVAEPSAVETDSPPTQLSPQPQSQINIQAGDLRYNQQGIILDQKAHIALEQAQQLGLLSGDVPEEYQQQHQGETYVSLSYLATLGIPVSWDAETRTAILDCCQSTALETISLAINNRDWPSAGMIVDNRAYVPQSKLTELNLDLEALNPAHSIAYQNETYVRASDLNDLSAVVQWDADSRVLSIRR